MRPRPSSGSALVRTRVRALEPEGHHGRGSRCMLRCSVCTHSLGHTHVQGPRLGVQAHRSVRVCLCAVYKHVFSKLKEKQSVISQES